MAESLCELVQLVWNKMQLANEAGSLLRVENELQEAIRKGQREWEEKQPLFRMTEFRLREEPKESYLRFVPGEGVTFWDRAENLVMAALREFASFTQNGEQLARRLFAEDAAQGFAFVDICRSRFDVVLMNPPFGEYPVASDHLLKKWYPDAKADILCAFVSSGCARVLPNGLVGAITNCTPLFTVGAEEWRKTYLLGQDTFSLHVFADLGHGVLDTALVEACAYCLSATGSDSFLAFSVTSTAAK